MKKLLVIVLMFVAVSVNAQWVNYTLPFDGQIYTLGFANVSTGVACGNTIMPYSARYFYTSNAGINWAASTFPPTIRSTVDVQFINSTLVYGGGAENIALKSLKNSNHLFLHLPEYIRNKFISKGITDYSAEYKTAFLKSTNAGASWQKVSTFDTLTGYMNNIHFFDANTGYALIDSNSAGSTRLYKTTNAGVNWQLIRTVEFGTELDNMHFFDMNTGFVSGIANIGNPGSYGVIFKTTNGGVNWVKTSFPRIDVLEDFTFFNATTGVAFGTSGDVLLSDPIKTTIYRTTNAGAQWDSVTSKLNRIFINLECLPSTGTAFGVGNLIDTIEFFANIATIKTTNYGASWDEKVLSQHTYGIGLSLIDQNNFMMSGGDLNVTPSIPRIFKSTNGGNVFVNQTGSEIPSTYSLSQNYPNPFNSSSKLKFEIAKLGDVKIIVYDVQGREVQTLVNERLNAGTYETRFDGSGLTSGVYFSWICSSLKPCMAVPWVLI